MLPGFAVDDEVNITPRDAVLSGKFPLGGAACGVSHSNLSNEFRRESRHAMRFATRQFFWRCSRIMGVATRKAFRVYMRSMTITSRHSFRMQTCTAPIAACQAFRMHPRPIAIATRQSFGSAARGTVVTARSSPFVVAIEHVREGSTDPQVAIARIFNTSNGVHANIIVSDASGVVTGVAGKFIAAQFSPNRLGQSDAVSGCVAAIVVAPDVTASVCGSGSDPTRGKVIGHREPPTLGVTPSACSNRREGTSRCINDTTRPLGALHGF